MSDDFRQLLTHLRNISAKSSSIPAQLCAEAADALDKILVSHVGHLFEEVKRLNKELHDIKLKHMQLQPLPHQAPYLGGLMPGGIIPTPTDWLTAPTTTTAGGGYWGREYPGGPAKWIRVI